MGKRLKWKLLSCLLLCLGAALLLSVPAGAVDVSDPITDETTKGNWQGVYGDCFVLLPDPKCTGFPEPEFGSALDGVCTTELDDFVSTFDLRREDGRPANTFWNTVNDCSQPESSPGGLCGTVAEQFDSCFDDFSMCDGSAQWNPCADAFKGTLWDEGDCFTPGGVVPPLIAELTLNLEGSTQLAYYFAAGCGSSRTQNWWLYIDDVLQKQNVITVTGDGQYLVFQLADVVPGTSVRFETQNQVPTACNPTPPPPGGPPNNSVLSGVFLSDCEQPAIEIVKEVSVDGGVTFFDANDSASAPATAVGGGALYRLTVTNTGTSDLENVVINDAALGIVNFPVGNLAAGQTVVLTQGEIPQLEQPGRCQDPGDVTNIATVDGQSVGTGNPVMDSDPAVVRCVEEAIDLLKEVSVDGGVTFFDANDSASAPTTAVGGGALYRLTVTNTGTSNLENVVINDAELGIVNFPVGTLAVGQTVVLTSGEIPQLEQPGRCQDPGDVTNIATVDGQSVDTGNTVSDSDPAVVRCEEVCVDIEKLVSVDGGQTFLDADECEIAPTTNSDAEYKLIVTNCGGVPLTDVTIKDPVLGIDVNIGTLAPGEVQMFTKTSPGFENLGQPGICPADDPEIENVATVTTFEGPTDSDPACVKCRGGGEGCTPGYWKQSQHFDSWTAPLTPDTLFSDVFEDAFPGMTLLDVLKQGGGKLKALGRHTVAALLNAASPGVSYDLSVDDVIGGFNDVYPGDDYETLKDIFEGFNEQGCPLN